MNKPKENDLRVWWIPQIPMDPFYVEVQDYKEAIVMLKTLAEYDIFQLKKNIKPDYSNAGGLHRFEDNEWVEWYSSNGDDIDYVMRQEWEEEENRKKEEAGQEWYIITWTKTYYASGDFEILAKNEEDAIEKAKDQLGDMEGSMQYNPDGDIVEAIKRDD